MNRWIYFCIFALFSLAIVIIEGRRSLSFTNAFEFHVEKCGNIHFHSNSTIEMYMKKQCCQNYCRNATKCIFGQVQEYTFPNATKEEVCLCYACLPKEWFVARNRVQTFEVVMVDFPYCSILLPDRANELCQGYCNGGEKCGNGACAINSQNEFTDRCICHKCPNHGEDFIPVFDPMF